MNNRRTFLKRSRRRRGGPAAPVLAQAQHRAASARDDPQVDAHQHAAEGPPYAERFAMAREAGFDAIEMQTIARRRRPRRSARRRRRPACASTRS